MPSGFRNAGGVDTDDLFEAGGSAADGFRRADGSTLAYADRGAAGKIADIGFRDASGQDLSNKWLPKGSAPPALGFNGQSYSRSVTALTGQTGTITASLTLTMGSDGTWTVSGSPAGGAASGTWLPAGGSASDYQVSFSTTVTEGPTPSALNNTAPALTSLSSSQSVTVANSVNAATTQNRATRVTVSCTLRRISTGQSTVSSCSFFVSATGQA